MEQLYNQLINNKGFTVDKDLNVIKDKGYFVSIQRTQTTIPINVFSYEVFFSLMEGYMELPNLIGGWIDSNLVYIDSTILINDLPTAINIALSNNQLAIFDNEKQETIYILEDLAQTGKYELLA